MRYLKNEKIKNVWISKEYLQKYYVDKKPRWVKFCEKLLNKNYIVFLSYVAKSIYITVIKNNKMVKLRYSNHLPKFESFMDGKIDYYVGYGEDFFISQNEILNILELRFKN